MKGKDIRSTPDDGKSYSVDPRWWEKLFGRPQMMGKAIRSTPDEGKRYPVDSRWWEKIFGRPQMMGKSIRSTPDYGKSPRMTFTAWWRDRVSSPVETWTVSSWWRLEDVVAAIPSCSGPATQGAWRRRSRQFLPLRTHSSAPRSIDPVGGMMTSLK